MGFQRAGLYKDALAEKALDNILGLLAHGVGEIAERRLKSPSGASAKSPNRNGNARSAVIMGCVRLAQRRSSIMPHIVLTSVRLFH
jgi:hypothetical protein